MPGEITKGRIEREEGVFYLEWDGGRDPMPADLLDQQPELKKLVGKEVEVLLSEPRPFVIAVRVPRRPPILCYLPAPPWFGRVRVPELRARIPIEPHPLCYIPADWMIKGVEEQVRINLADRMLQEEIISERVHDALIGR